MPNFYQVLGPSRVICLQGILELNLPTFRIVWIAWFEVNTVHKVNNQIPRQQEQISYHLWDRSVQKLWRQATRQIKYQYSPAKHCHTSVVKIYEGTNLWKTGNRFAVERKWRQTVVLWHTYIFEHYYMPLFITWCYNHGIKKLPNHWWARLYHFCKTISYHSNSMTC